MKERAMPTANMESQEPVMKSNRWKKTFVVFIALLLAIVSGGYIYWPGGWVWESPVQRAFPAVRLLVSNDIERISLKLDGQETNTRFALAITQAAVREYWLYDDTSGSQDIIECGASSADNKNKAASHAECFRSGAAIDIVLPAPPPLPTDDDKQRPAQKEKRKRYREAWLIPYQPSSFNALYAASAVRWSEVELRPYRGSGPTVKATDCAAPTDPKDLDECALVQEVLGHPQVLLARDPQLFIAASAKAATTRFVPAVVFFLMSVCVVILTFDMGLLALWLRGKPIAEPSKTGLVIDAENVWSGVRRILYTLEILGPAIGFAMTVLGLVVAFDKQAFGTQDRALFGSAISAALTVTLCGLLLRLLSFVGDRLIEHLSRWHADEAGMIYPDDTNLPVRARQESSRTSDMLRDEDEDPSSEPKLSGGGS